MLKEEITERVRRIAKSTDGLIVRLDTLSGRIDTANKNNNRELVEYYEREFTEASAEFMGGIETMIDDWYQLRGEKRPASAEEYISPEMLEEIHSAMVGIIHGTLPESAVAANQSIAPSLDLAGVGVDVAINAESAKPSEGKKGSPAKKPGHRVDITG